MLFVMVVAAFLAGGVAARLAWLRSVPTVPMDLTDPPRAVLPPLPQMLSGAPSPADLVDDELDLRLADFLAADGGDAQSRRWLLGPEVGV